MLGIALSKCELLLDGKCIYSYITKDVMDKYGAKPKDLEGIVSQPRVTEGVEVAVFMYELSKEEYKISLRASGDVNVSKIAEHFGGGGHVKAAGLNMSGNESVIISQLTEQIGKQL